MKKILSTLLAIVLTFTVIFALASCTTTQEKPETNEPTRYTVTFDSAGGSIVPAQTVESGKRVAEPTTPTKDGYTFLGWYLGSEKWSFVGYVITEDITLTAKWQENEPTTETYTVTFDSDGGTGILPQTVKSGTKATEPTAPTKNGYTFLGWYLGEEKWSFIGYVVTEDITLTAKWQENAPDPIPTPTYTVTFNPDNDAPNFTVTATEGDVITAPELPEKDGFTFLGWYFGEDKWSFTTNTVTANITLTAKWEMDEDYFLGEFDTDTPITITFYHSMGKTLQNELNDSIARFREIYPNITVVHKSYGSYDGVLTQIKTELTVGEQPNLAYCYADHVAIYNTSGAVKKLDIFMSDEKYGFTADELNNFIDGFFDEGKVFGDDSTYLLPIGKSTDVLYYNKTFFNKYGLSVPTTWDEMEALLKKIKEIDPACIPLGYDSESNLFITLAAQFGAPYTDATAENPFVFNNEANRQIVERIRTWYQNKWVTTEQLSGGYTSDLFTNNSDSGVRCYMVIGSTGGATYNQPNSYNFIYDFEVGITTIPQFNVSNPKVISQGPSICVFKNEDSQKLWASWLFLKHLATDDAFQATVCMNGYAPVTKSVLDNTDFTDFLATADINGTKYIQAYAIKVAIEQYGAMFVTNAFYGSAVAREQVGLLIQKCLAYEGTDVAAAIKSAFDAAVAECKYQCRDYYDPAPPTDEPENEYNLGAAKTFLEETYKNYLTSMSDDYDIAAKVIVDGVVYTVMWATDNTTITVKASEKKNYITVDLPEYNLTESTYKIIATIVAPDGTFTTLELYRTLPVYDNRGVTSTFEEGKAYKMFLEQKTLGQTLFALATSLSNNKYINTTNDPKAAADYYVEIVDGGYKFYTMVDGVKTYVYAHLIEASDGHFSKYIGFSTTMASVFIYDTYLKTFFVTIDDYKYGVGTYSNYATICISEYTHFTADSVGTTQFVIQFMDKAVAETLTPEDGGYADAQEITIAKAIEIGSSIENGVYTSDKYKVSGVITRITDTSHGRIYISDGTNEFQIYGLFSEDGTAKYEELSYKPIVGDTITVVGSIVNFFGTPEMYNGRLISYTKGDGNQGGNTEPETPTITENVIFEFGANGSATHVDGNDIGTGKTFTEGGYELVITDAYNVYDGAFDATGKSAIKLGTGSVAATLTFVVSDEVTSVVINAACYKGYADNNTIIVNGTTYTLTKKSADGEYEAITVDTTTTKTVTIETGGSRPRAMIDSIVFIVVNEGNEGGDTPDTL